MFTSVQQEINDIWDSNPSKETILGNDASVHSIFEALNMIDKGKTRAAEKIDGKWQVNDWVKKAILLLFKMKQMTLFQTSTTNYYDMVDMKLSNWSEDDFKKAKIRVVPGAIIRKYSYLEEGVVIMPSIINLGCYIGKNTMIDMGAVIGSCAQIGENCHISANVVIGGVLEPVNENPVIIEDNVFIGAGSQILEGILIEGGAVIASGVTIGKSTKIVDRKTGEITYGTIPKNSVVVSGTLSEQINSRIIGLQCAVIIKTADNNTRKKVSINDLLRE